MVPCLRDDAANIVSKSVPIMIELDEKNVKQLLAELCKKYTAFNNYYTGIKREFDGLNIKWKIDPKSAEEGISSPITNTITLKRYPESIRDARTVAHEIEHHLIWNRGYPYVMANINPDKLRTRRMRIAKALQAMIYEPMVESRLKHFFENLCSEHQKNAMNELQKRITEKNNILDDISNPLGLLYYSCLYIKYHRLIEATCDNDESIEFSRQYKEHFGKNIVPCAEKILALISTEGFNSPASVKKIFEIILQNRIFGLTYTYQTEFNRYIIDFVHSS
jgi:hypothetical protein